MAIIAAFSVREVDGVWLSCFSIDYPISNPERKNFDDFEAAYSWAFSSVPDGVLIRGVLPGMFYIESRDTP